MPFFDYSITIVHSLPAHTISNSYSATKNKILAVKHIFCLFQNKSNKSILLRPNLILLTPLFQPFVSSNMGKTSDLESKAFL